MFCFVFVLFIKKQIGVSDGAPLVHQNVCVLLLTSRNMHIILESTKYMRSSDRVMGGTLRVEIDTAVIALFVVHKKLLLVFHLLNVNKHNNKRERISRPLLESTNSVQHY